MHAGGKFNSDVYKVSGGLHGVGASVVNALSSHMIVEIRRDGKVYRDEYKDGGKPVTKLEKGLLPVVGTCMKNKTGTKVTFYPDDSIFETVEFKPETIRKKLKEIAYLNKNLKIVFKDEHTGEEQTYLEEFGIQSYIKYINRDTAVLHDDVIYIEGKSGDIEVEVAFQYTQNYSEQINAYCNRINVADGGTLVTGFKTALTRIMNQYARELNFLKNKEDNFDGKDIRNGLVAIVSIKHPDPQFESQTKNKLGNTDAKTAVDEVFNREAQRYFDKNVEVLKRILENVHKSFKARTASDKARKGVMKQLLDVDTKSKLAACSSKKSEECEIYIVEGDSAGGSAKTARNRNYQAILPIRGKILNVEKATIDKVLANAEIKTMINAFGCGFSEGYGNDFDISKLRYDKIIIMADADVDGAHISTLLLTLFYRFMPELIQEGHVYIAMPPLYKAMPKKGEEEYLYDDKALEKYRKTHDGPFTLQRYKGLGEMDADQLWETTMDPEKRILLKVTMDEAATSEIDLTFTTLMGDKVEPRREFIEENARFVKNLDI